MRRLLLAALGILPLGAQVCNPADLPGAYGFQLFGISRISGGPQPSAAVGRLEFDNRGNVRGVSSVNFNGYFLGNPVTGTYEFKTNCALTFRLQEPSGGWQHFRGTAEPDMSRIEFRQTDPGAGVHGEMRHTAASCTDDGFRGLYQFRMAGMTTPFYDPTKVMAGSASADVVSDGNGGLSWEADGKSGKGTYEVDSDCFVAIDFGAPFRGILVDSGQIVLAVESDPLQVGVATFSTAE
jgi:hypothetical protein